MSETTGRGALGWLREDLRRFDLLVATVATVIVLALVAASPGEFDSGWPEVASGVGVFVLLIFRRRAPVALLFVALVWVAAHVAIWERPTPMVFAGFILLATASIRVERPVAIGLGVLVGAGAYVAGLVVNSVELNDERAVIGIAWAAVAVGIGDATRTWRRYTASTQAELQSAVLAAEAQAQAQVSEERLTIAREVHDVLAHNLSVMNVQTGAALHLLRSDPDTAETALIEARDAGRSVLHELTDLLSVLRHDGDEAPTTSLPSVDELGDLVDKMRGSGLAVEWRQSGEPADLAPMTSLAAYRIVQEALTNAAKHGNGSAELATTWGDGGLQIQVANALGTRAGEGSGQGLVGMRERATLNGGRLDASEIDGRFVVDAWLPVATTAEVSQ